MSRICFAPNRFRCLQVHVIGCVVSIPIAILVSSTSAQLRTPEKPFGVHDEAQMLMSRNYYSQLLLAASNADRHRMPEIIAFIADSRAAGHDRSLLTTAILQSAKGFSVGNIAEELLSACGCAAQRSLTVDKSVTSPIMHGDSNRAIVLVAILEAVRNTQLDAIDPKTLQRIFRCIALDRSISFSYVPTVISCLERATRLDAEDRGVIASELLVNHYNLHPWEAFRLGRLLTAASSAVVRDALKHDLWRHDYKKVNTLARALSASQSRVDLECLVNAGLTATASLEIDPGGGSADVIRSVQRVIADSIQLSQALQQEPSVVLSWALDTSLSIGRVERAFALDTALARGLSHHKARHELLSFRARILAELEKDVLGVAVPATSRTLAIRYKLAAEMEFFQLVAESRGVFGPHELAPETLHHQH